MSFFTLLMSLLGIIVLIRTFIRYDPKLNLVQSGNRYILFLWYNKFNCSNEYEGRTYIKLFEL